MALHALSVSDRGMALQGWWNRRDKLRFVNGRSILAIWVILNIWVPHHTLNMDDFHTKCITQQQWSCIVHPASGQSGPSSSGSCPFSWIPRVFFFARGGRWRDWTWPVVENGSPYPLVISLAASWKIPALTGGFKGKIICKWGIFHCHKLIARG